MKKLSLAILAILSILSAFVVVGCDSQEGVKQVSPSSEEISDSSTPVNVEALETDNISGVIDYKDKITLPEGAVITVTLSDVSLMDVPAKVISQQVLADIKSSFPIDYSLKYIPTEIKSNHRYAVRADIHIDGKLSFVTDMNYAVITDIDKTKVQNLLLKKVN